MASNKKDDWEDVPLDQEQDDWEDQSVEPSWFSDQLTEAKDILAPAVETGLDFSSGVAKGLSMGSLDELGGVIGAGVETGLGALGIGPGAVDDELESQGFQVPEESFLEKYRGYQQASEQAQQEAAERSPIAETIGQVGGGITSGIALGGLLGVGKAAQGAKSLSEIAKNEGKAKAAMELLRRGGASYKKAAIPLAAESALTSKEQLLGPEANVKGLAADVAGGQLFGLPAIVGLEGVSQAVVPSIGKKLGGVKQKVSEAFADEGNPRLRQMAKSYNEYGKELGIHPRSHGQDIAGQKFAQRDQKAATSVWNMFTKADHDLGAQVGDSLNKATERGVLLDITPEIEGAASKLMSLATELPQIAKSARASQAYQKVLETKQQLTPNELKNLIDDLDFSIDSFRKSTQLRPGETNVVPELLAIRKQLSENLKKNVVEYKESASRFESFRNLKEQLISGDRPADVTGVYYGKLNNPDQKEYDRLIDMVQNVQKSSQSSQQYRTSFTNFMDALEKFQTLESSRLAGNSELKQVLPGTEQLRKFLLNASDDSVLRGSVRQTTESRSIVPDLKEAFIGKAPTSGAYLAGKAVRSAEKIAQKPLITKTVAMTKAVYKAPAQAVSNLASKLETTGNFKQLGKALRESVENGDTAKKNAALFTIMQNPNARAFISAEDFPDIESEE